MRRFVRDRAEQAWYFNSGVHLREAIEDSPGFEFFVVGTGGEYVLCHNHHDVLVGWGAAEPWVLSQLPADELNLESVRPVIPGSRDQSTKT